MADHVIVPSTVILGKGRHRIKTSERAFEGIDAGETVYFDKSGGGGWLLTSAAGTEAQARVEGMAINTAEVNGQTFDVLLEGEILLQSNFVEGVAAYLSANFGKLAPFADLVSTNFQTLVGIGVPGSNNRLLFRPLISDSQVP